MSKLLQEQSLKRQHAYMGQLYNVVTKLHCYTDHLELAQYTLYSLKYIG